MISGTELARQFPTTAARVVVIAEREGGDVQNALDVLISAVGVEQAERLVAAARLA